MILISHGGAKIRDPKSNGDSSPGHQEKTRAPYQCTRTSFVMIFGNKYIYFFVET